MMYDSFFSDAGWFFFAIWSIVVGTFSVTAFAPDLLASVTPDSHRTSAAGIPKKSSDALNLRGRAS